MKIFCIQATTEARLLCRTSLVIARSILVISSMLLFVNAAKAGSINVLSNEGFTVTALTDINQLGSLVGSADFNEGTVGAQIPLDSYSAQGMILHTGLLSAILPGVTTAGSAINPVYSNLLGFFPSQIGGGGSADGLQILSGGVATFSEPVTQFGLTASSTSGGPTFLTAWDASGNLMGQVSWLPDSDAAFVGIDTGEVPIAMIAYGNDDLFNRDIYDVAGIPAVISDRWIWASGQSGAMVPIPSAVWLFGSGLLGLIGVSKRKRAA